MENPLNVDSRIAEVFAAQVAVMRSGEETTGEAWAIERRDFLVKALAEDQRSNVVLIAGIVSRLVTRA